MTSNQGMWATPATAFNGTGTPHFRRRIPMHMTFFWGHVTEVLFPGWPGSNSAMYGLSLVFVFALALIVEWLTHSEFDFVKPGSANLTASLIRTAVHTVRSGLGYMVMLAVMSFNGGIFIAVLCGHTVGFFVFRTRALIKSAGSGSDTRPEAR